MTNDFSVIDCAVCWIKCCIVSLLHGIWITLNSFFQIDIAEQTTPLNCWPRVRNTSVDMYFCSDWLKYVDLTRLYSTISLSKASAMGNQ